MTQQPQQWSQPDTIVAPATGTGTAAVAVVRVSGPLAVPVLAALFRPASGEAPASMEDRRLVLGAIVSPAGDPLDEALAVVMRAPHSFTGEDVVEFQTHGGSAIVGAVMEACVAAGARPAQPGEFSRRAFLNGRMDLAQAEAIADLVAARTALGCRLALRQLRGGISQRVIAMRSLLLDAAAEIEAHLDFPDEEIAAPDQARILAAMDGALDELRRMLAGFARARAVREGARVAIAGKPNAGKSSLFNALVGRERAIVTPHPGTTRDTIECTVDLRGIPVTLVDTAGMREAADEIERMGIERTNAELRDADLVLAVTDATDATDRADGTLANVERAATDFAGSSDSSYASQAPHAPNASHDARSPSDSHAFNDLTDSHSSHAPHPSHASHHSRPTAPPTIAVLTKCDLLATTQPPASSPGAPLRVSAVTRAGLDQLERRIAESLVGSGTEEEMLSASARHAECLRAAQAALGQARDAFAAGQSGEFVMVDLREALLQLGDIVGMRLDDEILDRVFSRFCLGK